MSDIKMFSVRVELLRPRQTSYDRLARNMYMKGFKHVIKGRGGEWVKLPRGSFMISTADPSDKVKQTVTNMAIALDETALVKLAPVTNWAA